MPSLKQWIGLIIALGLTACAKPRAAVTEKTTVGLCSEEYKANSCAYKYDEGQKLTPLAQETDIEPIYFNKKLNLSQLSPTFGSSAATVYPFIKSQGLDVYSTKGGCGCDFFAKIPKAPVALMNHWNGIDKENLLGLFLPIVQLQEILPGSAKTPVLMLRADTDKWTLIHEYMHFLFDQQRTKNEHLSSDDIFYTFNSAASIFGAQTKTALTTDIRIKATSLSSYAMAYVNFLNAFLDYTTAFTLEEVTIESFLSEQYINGKLTQATSYARMGAAGYLYSKYREFNTLIAEFTTGNMINSETKETEKSFVGLDETKLQLASTGTESAETLEKFNALQNRIEKIKYELEGLRQKYVDPLKNASMARVLSYKSDCSHSSHRGGHEISPAEMRAMLKR